MKRTHLTVVLTAVATVITTVAFAQNASQALKLFEAGQYQRVVDQVQPNGDPGAVYVAAQSYQKLGQSDRARETYGALAARRNGDPWHDIGTSGQQLLQDDVDGALASANHAVAVARDLPEAHYQLGVVLARREEWPQAAAEFDRVIELNPSNAYAQYYGGLMYYRADRPDKMASHFEQFLTGAPDAPERAEVIQIMKMIRRQ